ncbi:hypothetical protein OAD85_08375 [Actinomycetota bacterium]|nr:hypothetical protein [Actinomycetota bacterium]
MKTKPWQIVALSTLCFIQAVHLISVVASKVAVKSNPAAVEAQAELGLASGGGASDVEAVYEHLGTSQEIDWGVKVTAITNVNEATSATATHHGQRNRRDSNRPHATAMNRPTRTTGKRRGRFGMIAENNGRR